MNDNIRKQSYSDIFNELSKFIEFYHNKGASYKDLKKYYLRSQHNFNEILEDIKFKAINLFEKEEEYRDFVKEILLDILTDRDFAEKDRIKKFESFK